MKWNKKGINSEKTQNNDKKIEILKKVIRKWTFVQIAGDTATLVSFVTEYGSKYDLLCSREKL